MSFRRAFVMVALAGAMAGACGETRDITDMGDDQGVLKQKGDPCGASGECNGGNCVDGICCESACTGTCEACNLPGQLGTCAPIAMGQDPQMECMPKPIVEVDGGTDDGGVSLNLPDAGVNAMQAPCAPKCDGKRACGFPDHTVACGDSFCNDATDVANTVCDGTGRCGIEVKACTAYVCGANACKTSCTSNADCQSTHFCNTLGQCQQKKDIGALCTSNGASAECQSGFCADSVCCNSDCGAIPSGKCNNVGAVGQCKCTIQPGNKVCDGVCELYYPDADHDGFGKKTDPGTVGCTGDPNNDPAPPAGMVLDHTDCGDDDARVKPGQGMLADANWTSLWQPQFDWNCDGVVTKNRPYEPGASCRFCNPRSWNTIIIGGGTCASGGNTTCSVAGQRAYFDCQQGECTGSGFCFGGCCGRGCGTNSGLFYTLDDGVFTSGGFNCGMSGTVTVCGTCDTIGTTNGSGTSGVTFSETQECK